MWWQLTCIFYYQNIFKIIVSLRKRNYLERCRWNLSDLKRVDFGRQASSRITWQMYIGIDSFKTCCIKSLSSIICTRFVFIGLVFTFYSLQYTLHAVPLISRLPNFKKNIRNISGCGISAMRKVFSNQRIWFTLSLMSKQAITIPCLLICYLLIAAKSQEVFIIFKINCVTYTQEMRLALLPESSKTKTTLSLGLA